MLKVLYLRHFRNFKDAVIEFSPGINHIYGKNAQGKTNLLEAIHFLISGRSFRTSHLKELIYYGENEFYIEAHFQKNGVNQTLKILSDGNVRKIWHNHTPLASLSGLLGNFLGVILSPEDSHLIDGTPAIRRQFLDLQISQSNPLYVYHLGRYMRAMKQRNALLKQRKTLSIECWEQEMALSGSFIALKRLLASQQLLQIGQPLQSWICPTEKMHVEYKVKETEEKALQNFYRSQYEKMRPKEFDVGITLIGPHKDDLFIYLNQKEARSFASEGQKRSVVANLRLAQWQLLKTLSEENPLLCIDDLATSLDALREEKLYEQLKNLGQVFVTSPKSLPGAINAHCIQVEAGRFLGNM